MGWFSEDAPQCEGYVVGLEVDPDKRANYRELRYPDERPRIVHAVQVGCECGWRSPIMTAPIGTHWYPFMIELPDARHEDKCRQIWREHLSAERRVPTTLLLVAACALTLGGCSLLVPDDSRLEDGDEITDGGGATRDGGAVDALRDAARQVDGGVDAAVYNLKCNPFNDPGACGCRVDNDPLGGPSCGIVGSTPFLGTCESSRQCDINLFCTGFTSVPGTCRWLCGGHLAVGCADGSTCVSVWWDNFFWWGYCP